MLNEDVMVVDGHVFSQKQRKKDTGVKIRPFLSLTHSLPAFQGERIHSKQTVLCPSKCPCNQELA